MNQIMVIRPYRLGALWVFDDEARGLQAEALVAGMDTLLDVVTGERGLAPGQFSVLFSDQEFPGVEQQLEWVRMELGGNWYYAAEYGIEGWLCPALFKYFASAPRQIYVQVVGDEKSPK